MFQRDHLAPTQTQGFTSTFFLGDWNPRVFKVGGWASPPFRKWGNFHQKSPLFSEITIFFSRNHFLALQAVYRRYRGPLWCLKAPQAKIWAYFGCLSPNLTQNTPKNTQKITILVPSSPQTFESGGALRATTKKNPPQPDRLEKFIWCLRSPVKKSVDFLKAWRIFFFSTLDNFLR